MATSEVFHFDEFTLDVRERRLLRGAEVVRLLPKAYDVLVALVQQRGRLVTKEDLLKRLWPESFVEEGGLTVHVSALRKALGEDARRPIYIETVARSGYRFIAAVTCDLAHKGLIGEIHLDQENYKAAEAACRKAPNDDSTALGCLMLSLGKQKRTDEAFEVYWRLELISSDKAQAVLKKILELVEVPTAVCSLKLSMRSEPIQEYQRIRQIPNSSIPPAFQL